MLPAHSHSPFLRIPLELREHVYTYILPAQIHAHFQDTTTTTLCISPCLQPDTDPQSSAYPHYTGINSHDGYERATCPTTHGGHVPAHVHARRLNSTWGPHWMCEEDMELRQATGVRSIAGVSRQIREEVLGIWGKRAVLHVTDSQTLDALAARLDGGEETKPWDKMLADVREVRVTLRMGLSSYQDTLDTTSGDSQHWTRLPAALARFPALKRLGVWLDHADTQTWARVDERAFLGPLLAWPLRFTLILPLLHPLLEAPERHFLAHSTPSNVTVVRKLRQRYRGEVNWRGELGAVHRPDFPFAIDAFDGEMTCAEAEVWERGEWERGEDVEAVAREMRVPSNVHVWI